MSVFHITLSSSKEELYQSQNIENALSLHDICLGSLAYVMRNNVLLQHVT